jgi:hypothetical protein
MRPYSIWFWALATSSLGLGLVVMPASAALLLGLDVPAQALLWARMAGLMALAYSLGYYVAAVFDVVPFMRASVLLRLASLPAVIGFIALGWAPTSLLSMALLDLAGALWTWRELALRAHRAPLSKPSLAA